MEAVTHKYPEGLKPGDVVVLNDPYLGGMHLPDIFMFQPVFSRSVLLGYAVVVAHHNDMGGRVPGSSAADSTEIFQEGLRIPILKLYCDGIRNETLFDIIRINVRVPDVVLGDLAAQVAACRIAERGMQELAEGYGEAELLSYFEDLLDYSEREARRSIRAIPDGTYRFVDHLDDDGVHPDQPVRIEVAVTVADDHLTVDPGRNVGAGGRRNQRHSVVCQICRLFCGSRDHGPGCAEQCRILPADPAHRTAREPIQSLSSGGGCRARGERFRLIDALLGALAQAMPDRVRAAGEGGTTSYSIAARDADGRFVLFREAMMGAWGAGAGRDGIDGAANPACNIGNAPVEAVEHQAPVRVERYELLPDSGGAGEFRGGMSVIRELRFLGQGATLQLRSDRRRFPPYGLAGGEAGGPSATLLHDGTAWRELPTKITRSLQHGERLRHVTAGAGGYGNPRRRDPAAVLADVRDGKVTAVAAREKFGVAFHPHSLGIDEEGTRLLRQNERNPTMKDAAA